MLALRIHGPLPKLWVVSAVFLRNATSFLPGVLAEAPLLVPLAVSLETLDEARSVFSSQGTLRRPRMTRLFGPYPSCLGLGSQAAWVFRVRLLGWVVLSCLGFRLLGCFGFNPVLTASQQRQFHELQVSCECLS